MKILLMTSSAVPWGGGIASYNQELVRELGRDNEIHLLTDADESDVPGYMTTCSTFGKPIHGYSYCRGLADDINSSGYDLIISSYSGVLPYLSPFLRAPIISISHFVNGKPANNAGFNSASLNGIVALSYYGKEYLEKRFRINDPDKVKVIYNFVGAASHPYDGTKENGKPLRIVYPGGTTVHKSVDFVMDALYRLVRTNLDFEFVWLGDTRLVLGKFSPLGQLHTSGMISDPRVRILGKVSREEAVRQISSANVFLLPSVGEGCPMTLLEAMREGCIPVVSDAGHGSRELLEACGCGAIVKQNDARALSDILQDIILNHGKYAHCYKDTFDFSLEQLSESKWSMKMKEAVSDAFSRPAKRIAMTRPAFWRSMIPYVIMQAAARFSELCSYVKSRVRMDIMYIKNKNISHE